MLIAAVSESVFPPAIIVYNYTHWVYRQCFGKTLAETTRLGTRLHACTLPEAALGNTENIVDLPFF